MIVSAEEVIAGAGHKRNDYQMHSLCSVSIDHLEHVAQHSSLPHMSRIATLRIQRKVNIVQRDTGRT